MNLLLSPRPRRRLATLAVTALLGQASCNGPPGDPQVPAVPKQADPAGAAVPAPGRAGITPLEPGATLPTAAGQSIYVPIQTRLVGEDGPIRLTVNLAVRNTDESRPILVTLLRHRDADGTTVRDYLRAPARLAPKATLDLVLRDPDGPGPAASVLVEWVADRTVAPPMVEAVMVGSSGLAFAERGQVISDRQVPAPPR
jgi:hypothetical protein